MNERLRLSTGESYADQAGAYVFFRVGFVRHMNDVARAFSHSRTWLTAVPFIQTQMLLGCRWVRPLNRHGFQGGLEQSSVRSISAANHNSQGQAVFIHQQTPLGAYFAAIRRVFPRLFAAQGSFGHRAIRCLPRPVKALEFVVLSQSRLPHPQENSSADPALKVAMRRLARTTLLGQRVPLAPRAHDVQDARHHFATICGRAAATMFPILPATAIPRFRFGQQWFDPRPETIRQFPAGDVGVLRLSWFSSFRHACILLPEQV